MNVTVIRHLAFEDIGSFSQVFDNRGMDVDYVEAGLHDLAEIEPLSDDLLLILGGPISVNDVEDYPFLLTELDLLKVRLAADKPTLGICLGAQLMARALGSTIYSGGRKEIGWYDLQVHDAGEVAGMHWLDKSNTRMLHWHGETFDIPEGATSLASSELFANQAFSYGRRCLAVQFHPEVTASGLERWYIGHTGEIASTPGISVASLRADSQQYAGQLEVCAGNFLNQWLDACVLDPA